MRMYAPLLFIAIIVASFKDALQVGWKSPLPMTSTFQSLWNTDSNTNHEKPSQDKTWKTDMTSPSNGAENSDRLPRWNPVTASPQRQWSNKRTKHRRHWGRRLSASQQKNGPWESEPTIHREQSNYQSQSQYKNGYEKQRGNSWGQKVASSNGWEPVNSQAPWETRVDTNQWGSRVDTKPWENLVDTKSWGSRVENKQLGSRVNSSPWENRVSNKPLASRTDSSPWGRPSDSTPRGSRVDNNPLEGSVDNSPWGSRVQNKPLEGRVDNSPWGSRVENKPLENRVDNSPWGRRVDNKPLESRVDNSPWGRRVENKPSESRVDNSPWGRRVDTKPLENRADNSPWGSRVENKPSESRVDNSPWGSRVDNKPSESRVDNSPWGSRVDNKPLENRADNSPWGSRVDNKPLENRVDNSPWGSRVDNSPWGRRVDNKPLGNRVDNSPWGRRVDNKPWESHVDKINARPKEDTWRSSSNKQHNSRDTQRYQDPNNGRNSNYPGDINPPNVRNPQHDYQSHPSTQNSYITHRAQKTEKQPYNTLRELNGRDQHLESRQQKESRYVNQPRNSKTRHVPSYKETYASPPPTTPVIYPEVNNQYDLYSNPRQSEKRRQNEVLGSISKDSRFQNNNGLVELNRINLKPKDVPKTSHHKSSDPANPQKQRESNRTSMNFILYDSSHPPNKDLLQNIDNQNSYLTKPPQPSVRILENFKTFEQQHNIRKPKRQSANSVKLERHMELNNDVMNQAQVKATRNSDYLASKQPNNPRNHEHKITQSNKELSKPSLKKEMNLSKTKSPTHMIKNLMLIQRISESKTKEKPDTSRIAHSKPGFKDKSPSQRRVNKHDPNPIVQDNVVIKSEYYEPPLTISKVSSPEPKPEVYSLSTTPSAPIETSPVYQVRYSNWVPFYSYKAAKEKNNPRMHSFRVGRKSPKPTESNKKGRLQIRNNASNLIKSKVEKKVGQGDFGKRDIQKKSNDQVADLKSKQDRLRLQQQVSENVKMKTDFTNKPETITLPTTASVTHLFDKTPTPEPNSNPQVMPRRQNGKPLTGFERQQDRKSNVQTILTKADKLPFEAKPNARFDQPKKRILQRHQQITIKNNQNGSSRIMKAKANGNQRIDKTSKQAKTSGDKNIVPNINLNSPNLKSSRVEIQEQSKRLQTTRISSQKLNSNSKITSENPHPSLTLEQSNSNQQQQNNANLPDIQKEIPIQSKVQKHNTRVSKLNVEQTIDQSQHSKLEPSGNVPTRKETKILPSTIIPSQTTPVDQTHAYTAVSSKHTNSRKDPLLPSTVTVQPWTSSMPINNQKPTTSQMQSNNGALGNLQLKSKNIKPQRSKQGEITEQGTQRQTTRLPQQEFNVISETHQQPRLRHRGRSKHRQRSSSFKQSNLNQLQQINEKLSIPKEFIIEPSIQKPDNPVLKLNFKQNPYKVVSHHSKLQPSEIVPVQRKPPQLQSSKKPSENTPVEGTHSGTVSSFNPVDPKQDYMLLPSTATVQPWTHSVPINKEYLITSQIQSNIGEFGNMYVNSKNLRPRTSLQSEIKEQDTQRQTTRLPQQEFSVISETRQTPLFRHRERFKHRQRSSSYKKSDSNQLQQINENLNIPKEFLIEPSIQEPDNPVLKLNFEQNPDKVALHHSKSQPSENIQILREPTQFHSSKRPFETTQVERSHSDTVLNFKPLDVKSDNPVLKRNFEQNPEKVFLHHSKLQPSENVPLQREQMHYHSSKRPFETTPVERSHSFSVLNSNPMDVKSDNPAFKRNFEQNPEKDVLHHSKLQPSENVPIQREQSQFHTSKRPFETTPVERSHSYTVLNSNPMDVKSDNPVLKRNFEQNPEKVVLPHSKLQPSENIQREQTHYHSSKRPFKSTPIERSHSYTALNSHPMDVNSDNPVLKRNFELNPEKVVLPHSKLQTSENVPIQREQTHYHSSKGPFETTPAERSHSYTVLNSNPMNLKEDFTRPSAIQDWINPEPIQSNNGEFRRSDSVANRHQIHSKGHKFQSHEQLKHIPYREITSHQKPTSVSNSKHGSPQSGEIIPKDIHKISVNRSFRTKSKAENINSHQPDRFVNIDTRTTVNNVQRDYNIQKEHAYASGYQLPENQAPGYSDIRDHRRYVQPETGPPTVNRHNPSPIYESMSQPQHVRSNHYDFRRNNKEIYQGTPQTPDFTHSRGIVEGNSQNNVRKNNNNDDDNSVSSSTNPNSWVSPLHDGLGTGVPIPRPVVRVVEPAFSKYKVRHADGATTKEQYNQVAPFVQRIVNYIYDTTLESYKVSDYLVMDRRSNIFALRSGRDTCFVGALNPSIVNSFEEFALYTKTIETRPPVFDSNPHLMIYIETQQLKYREVNSTAGKYIAGSCGTANIYAVKTVVQDPIRTSNGTVIPGDACPFGKPLRNPRSWHVARCPTGYCPSMSHTCNIQYEICCPEIYNQDLPKGTKCVSLSIGQLCVTPSPERLGFS